MSAFDLGHERYVTISVRIDDVERRIRVPRMVLEDAMHDVPRYAGIFPQLDVTETRLAIERALTGWAQRTMAETIRAWAMRASRETP